MTVQFSPDDDILDIRFDNVFKAIFTKDTTNSRASLADLISAAIDVPVIVDAVLQNEPAPEDINDRQIRFDIHCRAKDGQLINVEMTMYPDQSEPLRIEFFTCKLHTSQDIRGKNKTYSDLMPTYHISILAKKNLIDDQKYYHRFEYYDSVAMRLLGGRTHIITIELAKADDVAKKSVDKMSVLERWIIFLINSSNQAKREMVNQILKSEEGISMAAETLLAVSKDENERARLLNEYRIILDYQSGLAAAKREGEQRGELLGKINSVVNAIKSWNSTVTDAMRVMQLGSEYRDSVIAELKKQNISFTE